MLVTSIRTKNQLNGTRFLSSFTHQDFTFVTFVNKEATTRTGVTKQKNNEAKSRENIRKMIEKEKHDAREIITEGSLPNEEPSNAETTTSNFPS